MEGSAEGTPGTAAPANADTSRNSDRWPRAYTGKTQNLFPSVPPARARSPGTARRVSRRGLFCFARPHQELTAFVSRLPFLPFIHECQAIVATLSFMLVCIYCLVYSKDIRSVP